MLKLLVFRVIFPRFVKFMLWIVLCSFTLKLNKKQQENYYCLSTSMKDLFLRETFFTIFHWDRFFIMSCCTAWVASLKRMNYVEHFFNSIHMFVGVVKLQFPHYRLNCGLVRTHERLIGWFSDCEQVSLQAPTLYKK